MKKNTQSLLFNAMFIGVLTSIWFYPGLLSTIGIALVITWAYSLLLAQVMRVSVQYAMLKWGVNRQGMLFFALGIAAIGAAIMYYAYTKNVYSYLGFGWVVCYAGFDSARHVYNRRVANVVYQFMTTLEYAVVTLFILAVFGSYIADSPIGRLGIEYQGLRGESLLFIVIIMTSCGLVHQLWFLISKRVKAFFGR